jgi:hypothetical protein
LRKASCCRPPKKCRALSLVTGRPLLIEKIRAGQKKPGLLPQHLTAVLAAAEVSGAEVEGVVLGYFPKSRLKNPRTPLAGSLLAGCLEVGEGGALLMAA